MCTLFRRWSSYVALSLFVLAAPAAKAETQPFVFAIDSSQSPISVQGDIAGTIPFQEQAPGSLSSAFEGTFSVQLSRTAGVYTSVLFEPTNTIEVIDQPGLFHPFNAPADLAGQALVIITTGYIAYRNTVARLDSGLASIPIDGAGEFPLGGVLFYTSTILDAEAPPLLSPQSTPNVLSVFLPGFGSLDVVGNLATLTIPIYAVTSSDANDLHIVLNQTFAGQIVATATVPEPSGLVLAATGLLATAALRRRKS